MYTVVELEKRLGFRWDRGLAVNVKACREVECLTQLLYDIENLQHDFAHQNLRKTPPSRALKDRIEDIFYDYADEIWPLPPVDTSAWLVDANVNNWQGLYPRNLAYRNSYDQNMFVAS